MIFFQLANWENRHVLTNKKFVFFCNCSNWEKLVKQIGENIWWIHNFFLHRYILTKFSCCNFYYKKKKKMLKKFVKMLWLIKKKFSRTICMVPKSQRTKSISNADMQFILQSSNIVICLIFFWMGRLFKSGGKSFKCPNCGWFGQKLRWKSQSYFESLRIG